MARVQEMLVVGGDNDAEGDDVAEDGESVGLEAVLSQVRRMTRALPAWRARTAKRSVSRG